MANETISESSFTAVINAPIEKIDIADWLFDLPDAEYQRCWPRASNANARPHVGRLDGQETAMSTRTAIATGKGPRRSSLSVVRHSTTLQPRG